MASAFVGEVAVVTPRKPYGYIDNEHVDRAAEANARMAEMLLEVSDLLAQEPRLAKYAVAMAVQLSAQANALREVQAVRRPRKDRERLDDRQAATE